jgi:hypothetical protein
MGDKRKIGHGLATARYHHELLVSLIVLFIAASMALAAALSSRLNRCP